MKFDGELPLPIKVVNRGDGHITYDVLNTLDKSSLDFVYIQHHDMERNSPCISFEDFQENQTETLMSLCMSHVPVAMVDIFIVDSDLEGIGDPKTEVPKCCHGKHDPDATVIHLEIELFCECPAVVS